MIGVEPNMKGMDGHLFGVDVEKVTKRQDENTKVEEVRGQVAIAYGPKAECIL